MIRKKKKTVITLTVCAVLLLALIIWIAWGNTALELNTYTIQSGRLPENFSGYRIAHISDLHNAEMGRDNGKLIAILRQAAPDIIVITGDLIDSRRTDVGIALEFAEQAVQIAPCYYVTGNHEARIAEYSVLKAGLTDLGVTMLENMRIELEKDGQTVALLGVDDPSFQTDYLLGDAQSVIKDQLQDLATGEDMYTILLSHRPELFDAYVASDIDLVFSGHAHGGQFRLPFVGGLVAPNQGFFPKYDAGIYTCNSTNMIVSRGIGNSIVPVRFNNRPEVVLIKLQRT